VIGLVAALAIERVGKTSQSTTACAKLALALCVQHIALIEPHRLIRVWTLSVFPSMESKAIALRKRGWREGDEHRVPFRTQKEMFPSSSTSPSLF